MKQLCAYLNLVFPGGALYLVATEAELKRLLMELTGTLLQNNMYHHATAARKIGVNTLPDGTRLWVFAPDTIITERGSHLQRDQSPLLWLERPSSSTMLIDSSLACSISTPLDEGSAFASLCSAIQAFMPENFLPAMATISSCVMGAAYTRVIATTGCIGVPMLFGQPGTCKSEALKCGLSVFGAERSNLFNSQTTLSFLFATLMKTTIPVGVDDVSEKAQDV